MINVVIQKERRESETDRKENRKNLNIAAVCICAMWNRLKKAVLFFYTFVDSAINQSNWIVVVAHGLESTHR